MEKEKLKTFEEMGDFLGMAIFMDEHERCFAIDTIPKKLKVLGIWYCWDFTPEVSVDKHPIEVTNIVKRPTCDWKDSLYVPKCLSLKYKPYTDFERCWFGEIVILTSTHELFEIRGFALNDDVKGNNNEIYVILRPYSKSGATMSMDIKKSFKEMLEQAIWYDGEEPFGEKINEN